MDKGNLFGISNTEDVIWFKLSPSNESLKKIDLIFDIHYNLYENDVERIKPYNFYVKSRDYYFHKENKNYIAYFIFTKNLLHVILRKTLNWKKYRDEINKKFDFKK